MQVLENVPVGKIVTTLTVINRADQILEERGFRSLG